MRCHAYDEEGLELLLVSSWAARCNLCRSCIQVTAVSVKSSCIEEFHRRSRLKKDFHWTCCSSRPLANLICEQFEQFEHRHILAGHSSSPPWFIGLSTLCFDSEFVNCKFVNLWKNFGNRDSRIQTLDSKRFEIRILDIRTSPNFSSKARLISYYLRSNQPVRNLRENIGMLNWQVANSNVSEEALQMKHCYTLWIIHRELHTVSQSE